MLREGCSDCSYVSSLEMTCRELQIENESLHERLQRQEASIEREVERRIKQRLEDDLK